jgi:hypothetical protein
MEAALFASVESPEFSARLNVVSGWRQFLRGLAEAPEVKALLATARSQEGALEVFYRLLEAVRVPYDPAYENPADVAIAAYLFVLSFADHELAALASELALDCGGCWWARKLAEAANSAKSKHSASVRLTREAAPQPAARARATHTADFAFTYFAGHGSRPAGGLSVGRRAPFTPTLSGGRTQRNRGSANKWQTLEAVA